MRKLTLMLWNSTQLPALLLAVFTCSSSIPTSISRSENLRPPAGIVGLWWQPEPAKLTSAQSNTLAPPSLISASFFLFISSSSSPSLPLRSQVQKPLPLQVRWCRSMERDWQINLIHKLFVNKQEKADFLKLNLELDSHTLSASVCLAGRVFGQSSWSSPPLLFPIHSTPDCLVPLASQVEGGTQGEGLRG